MFTRIRYGMKNGIYNYSKFVCDSETDIANLPTNTTSGGTYAPCSFGSEAIAIAEGKKFILSNENEWVERIYAGSIDGSIDVNVIVNDDNNGNVVMRYTNVEGSGN